MEKENWRNGFMVELAFAYADEIERANLIFPGIEQIGPATEIPLMRGQVWIGNRKIFAGTQQVPPVFVEYCPKPDIDEWHEEDFDDLLISDEEITGKSAKKVKEELARIKRCF